MDRFLFDHTPSTGLEPWISQAFIFHIGRRLYVPPPFNSDLIRASIAPRSRFGLSYAFPMAYSENFIYSVREEASFGVAPIIPQSDAFDYDLCVSTSVVVMPRARRLLSSMCGVSVIPWSHE
nr:uncharacterized protein I203_06938 [Kwoniella mangroviensis CBS 8507]OCF63982.1 hypothetical protein I203_06938 [Kwoniella mangroviensis CBS 8507]